MTGTEEFSRRVAISDVPGRGLDLHIEASPEERAALALRLGLLDLGHLSARLRLKPVGNGGLFRLSGSVTAKVVQACVVTLQPVAAQVEEEFAVTFGPEDDEDDPSVELDLSFDQDDPPDAIVDGGVDVGAAVTEHLALALDPFPRAAGAVFDPPPESPVPGEKPANPFAVLAGLRKNDG